MNKYTFTTYNTLSKDKTRLYGNYLIPNTTPLAVIYLIHGLGGHSGRFLQAASMFIKQNIAVVSIDLRGHGLSEGKRGHAKHTNNLLEDIDAAIEVGNKLIDTQTPKIIYGNSMGGLLALKYALNNKKIFAGIVLTAPWFKLTKPLNKLLLFTLLLFSHIYPKYTFSSKIRSSELRSDSIKEEARNDNLVHKKISARLFSLIHKLGNKLLNCTKDLNIPTFIIHGINDSVTDSKASKSFCSSHNEFCSFLPLENTMHEIHMEADNNKIYKEINQWIKNTIKQKNEKF